MKMHLGPILLFGALAALFLAGWAPGIVAQNPDDAEVRDRKKEFLYILDEGEWGRLQISMFEGAGINYVISSGNRHIEFHMYREAGPNEVVTHIGPKRTTSDSGTFVAPSNGVYTFNTTRDAERQATVRLNINGEFGIRSMEGMEQAQEVPAPAVAAALAALACTVALIHRRRTG